MNCLKMNWHHLMSRTTRKMILRTHGICGWIEPGRGLSLHKDSYVEILVLINTSIMCRLEMLS